MASVWKRLQRVNKRAAKFQYTASYHRIDLETSPKWKPTKLCIVWTRRSRRVVTDPMEWEPSLKDPLKGCVLYPIPENRTVTVTLFKDSRTNELEDKDWTFVLEDVSASGKHRKLASSAINMRTYASVMAHSRPLVVELAPTTNRVVHVTLHVTLHCVLVREGSATDEDMQSLASLLSVNNNSDIAVLEDLDEDDFTMSDNSTRQMLDFRQQMEEMTNSLTISDIATPNSVQSLNFDNSRTPVGEQTPLTPFTPLTPLTPLTPVNDLPTPKNESVISSLNNLLLKPITKPRDTEIFVKESNIKPTVFKTKHLSKLNLKPLELKTNLNEFVLDKNDNRRSSKEGTPATDGSTPPVENAAPRADTDKTPVQDLLEWCKEVTSEYKSCRVTNLTTSWRSGLAFCAIIHHYRPDLIAFSGLQPQDAEANLRIAFEASAKLGVSQVITASDILDRAPDRLAIMTHLFQLRAHFTGKELHVEQLGADGDESSYLVGRHDTDAAAPRDLFSREVAVRRSKQNYGELRPSLLRSPDVDHQHLAHTETPPVRPEKLMTRKELTDPFGSDDEDDQPPVSANTEIKWAAGEVTTPTTDTHRIAVRKSPDLPKPTPQLLSRHDELKERARQLLEATKREAREGEMKLKNNSKDRDDDIVDQREENIVNGELKNVDVSPKKLSEEERQVALRERARKLIADARAGIVSPTSPSGGTAVGAARGVVEIISRQSVLDEIAAAGGVEQVLESARTPGHTPGHTPSHTPSPASRNGSLSPDRSVEEPLSSDSRTPDRTSSPLHSFSGLCDTMDILPGDEEGAEQGYIASEMCALEQEQRSIDVRAAALERELRHVMQSADHAQEEDRLMAQWFHLVNKKNALLRRQMQLNILEQEEDLSRRCELLARELRLSLAVDEWRKTSGQKRRERLLLQELVAAVNKRDRLVQEMDEQERAIADDNEIERNILQADIQKKNNCLIQ